MTLSEALSIASARNKKVDFSLQCFIEVNTGSDKVLLTGAEITIPRKRMGIFSVFITLDILSRVLDENLR
jgi:hypothetical protein